jgi:hypothetical protein
LHVNIRESTSAVPPPMGVTNERSRELRLSLLIAVDSAFDVALIVDTFVSFVTCKLYIILNDTQSGCWPLSLG